MATKRKKDQQVTPDIVCVDLFCGAGGLTHGLIQAGLKVVAGVDFDSACKHPYEANHKDTKFYERDVADLQPSEVRDWFGNAPVRVLAGCAPCQPFSSYSQRYDFVGTERWGLLEHFGRIIEGVKPDIVTMENVPKVMEHEVFDKFVAKLKALNYEVQPYVVNSAEYGLPQQRRRLVLFASLRHPVELVRSTVRKIRTVRKAFEGLPEITHGNRDNKKDPLHTASRLSPLNLERIQASEPGGSWRDWPKRLIARCHRKKSGKTYPGVYGRMEWDEPAPTLTTQFYGFGNGRFGHPEEDRGISLREGAILQGFPKRYSFVPKGETVQFKTLGRLIGNAVPVVLGKVIGDSIVEHVQRFPLQEHR